MRFHLGNSWIYCSCLLVCLFASWAELLLWCPDLAISSRLDPLRWPRDQILGVRGKNKKEPRERDNGTGSSPSRWHEECKLRAFSCIHFRCNGDAGPLFVLLIFFVFVIVAGLLIENNSPNSFGDGWIFFFWNIVFRVIRWWLCSNLSIVSLFVWNCVCLRLGMCSTFRWFVALSFMLVFMQRVLGNCVVFNDAAFTSAMKYWDF